MQSTAVTNVAISTGERNLTIKAQSELKMVTPYTIQIVNSTSPPLDQEKTTEGWVALNRYRGDNQVAGQHDAIHSQQGHRTLGAT